MKRIIPFTVVPVLLVFVLMLATLSPAVAQKKKKDSPAAAVQQTAPAESPSHQAAKIGGTIHEVLVKLQGQQTNLGVLSKVVGDYVMFDNEGDTLIYPISALQVVKLLKAEEGEQRKIEIRFFSRD